MTLAESARYHFDLLVGSMIVGTGFGIGFVTILILANLIVTRL